MSCTSLPSHNVIVRVAHPHTLLPPAVVPFNTSSPTFRASTSPSVVKTSLEGQSLTYITGCVGPQYVI